MPRLTSRLPWHLCEITRGPPPLALTFGVIIECFGCHVAVCVNKPHKMQILGAVSFKISTMTEDCLSS